jgi:hypothetical protein
MLDVEEVWSSNQSNRPIWAKESPMNILKRFAIATALAVAFLSAGAFGARAENVDVDVGCRTAADLELFSNIAEKILADQTISVNTGYELAVTQEGLDKTCIVADIDSFAFKQKLGGKGDMSVVVYIDPTTKVAMSLIGFTPMDEDTPASADVKPALASVSQ